LEAYLKVNPKAADAEQLRQVIQTYKAAVSAVPASTKPPE
jgi:hypothetical protein